MKNKLSPEERQEICNKAKNCLLAIFWLFSVALIAVKLITDYYNR